MALRIRVRPAGDHISNKTKKYNLQPDQGEEYDGAPIIEKQINIAGYVFVRIPSGHATRHGEQENSGGHEYAQWVCVNQDCLTSAPMGQISGIA